MRQKTGFSVVGNDVNNVAFVSENEGSDLGIPWPDGPPSSDCPVVWHADGPPSSDCPVGWHTDDAPRRHRVRDRGSRPVLAQNQGVRVPIPAGAFYAPKNTPQGVSRGKSSVSRRRNPSLAHTAGSSGSSGLVSSSAAQTLPSTRAGGQDDGSYNKLPQINIIRPMFGFLIKMELGNSR